MNRREIKKILVIQLRQIGDVLLTMPAVEVLSKNFPKSQIDFLVEKPAHEIAVRNPFINHVLIYEKSHSLKWIFKIRKAKYDLVIDFLSNPRSALLTYLSGAQIKAGPDYTSSKWAYNLRMKKRNASKYTAFLKIDLLKKIGIENIFYPYPKFFLTGEDELHALSELRKLSIPDGAFIVAFAPTSKRPTRKWPEEHYAKLSSIILEKYPDFHILVFWGPGEYETAKKIKSLSSAKNLHIAPRLTSLSRLGAMLKKCAILVSNFNGSMHIAQAVGTQTLGIASYDYPESWRPPSDPRHQAIKLMPKNCDNCKKNKCDKGMKCIVKLTPEAVFSKFEEMLHLMKNYEPPAVKKQT